MQKILLFAVFVMTLGLGGCDWFRGTPGPPGPAEQRAIKAIPATPVLQVLRVHLGQQARREFPGPGGLRGLLRLRGLLLLGKAASLLLASAPAANS